MKLVNLAVSIYLFCNLAQSHPVKHQDAVAQNFQFNIYDHNIKVENNNEGKGESSWDKRKGLLIDSIRNNTADQSSLVGLQEVLHAQLDDILDGLGDDWKHAGVGRDDGAKKGEYSPILYQKSVWKKLSFKTYWLSPTPDVPSKGWDAKFNRIVTVTEFQHKATGYQFHYLNTHLDADGKVSRLHAAEIIDSVIGNFTDGLPVFLSGDFNSQPTDDAYKTISTTLIDSSSNKSLDHGFTETWTGFNHETQSIIDYIFYSHDPKIDLLYHEVLNSNYSGLLISDHRPLLSKFSLSS